MRIAASSWSFQNSIIGGQMTLQQFVDVCSQELGLDAVEYVESQLVALTSEERGSIVDYSHRSGCDIVCLAASADLAVRDGEVAYQEEIDSAVQWAKWAQSHGVSRFRVNSGYCCLTGDAADRMADGILRILSGTPGKEPVVVIENLGSPWECAENIVDLIRRMDSNRVGACLDFGNFGHQDPYEAARVIAPYAKHVHAKSYEFTKEGSESTLDYSELFGILSDSAYSGTVSVEFEGENSDDELDGAKRTLALIRMATR